MENWDPTVFTTVAERSSTLYGIPAPRMEWTYPEGMRSNAELGNLTEALLKLGFGTQDVPQVSGRLLPARLRCGLETRRRSQRKLRAGTSRHGRDHEPKALSATRRGDHPLARAGAA